MNFRICLRLFFKISFSLMFISLFPINIVLGEEITEKNEEITENKIYKLEEIVITSTSKTKALDTPASVSIITGKELEEMGAKDAIEALKRVPGVLDTSASRPSVSIRGTKSIMAGGPVILIDGVPQKSGIYRYDQLDFIPVSQIERIEVLKSSGITFGPGSTRGVINIITKKGEKDKGAQGNISLSYGSWNTHNETGSILGKNKKTDYLLNFSNSESDGYEDEKSKKMSGMLKAGYNFSEDTRLGFRFSSTFYQTETARGMKKYKDQIENDRREKHFMESGKLVWHDEKEKKTLTTGLNFTHKNEKYFINSDLSYSSFDNIFHWDWDKYYSKDSSSSKTRLERADIEEEEQSLYNFNMSGGYHFDFSKVSYTPTIGIRYETTDFQTRTTFPYDVDDDRADSRHAKNVDIEEIGYGIFWDNDFTFIEKIGLKLGIRYDTTDIVYSDQTDDEFDRNEKMLSWSLAPSYHFNKKSNIYLLVEKGYWLPTPYYYYSAYSKRDEIIEPESTVTYELGYKHRFADFFNMALSVFKAICDDKIAVRYDDVGDSEGMDNVGTSETSGIELEVDGEINKYVGYRFAGSYLEAKWTDGDVKAYDDNNDYGVNDLDGKYIKDIPNYTFTVGVDTFPVKNSKISLDILTVGPYYVDYLNKFKHSSHTTVNIMASYKLDEWKFWIQGKNIFDEEVNHEYNSAGKEDANGNSISNYFVQDGLYLESGVTLKF